MKRALIGLFVVAAVVVGFLMFGSTTDRSTDPTPVDSADPNPTAQNDDGPDADRKSLLPKKFPGQAEESDLRPEAREPTVDETELNPTVGLEMVAATDADRLEAKAPDERWGKGVIVMGVHPDSPADEVRLKKGDLIVRAQREHINSPQDLIDASAGRDHVVVTFVRNGKYLQVVLKKPYRPEDN